MERNRHIDEGTLHAWLEGALGAEDAARVEAHVASCAACRTKAAEARGLIAAASRILTALDDVPGDVVPGGSGGRVAGARFSASPERRRRPFTGWPLRAAAAIVFVATGTLLVVQRLGITEHRVRETAAAATAAAAPPTAAPLPLPPADKRPAPAPRPAEKKAAPRLAAKPTTPREVTPGGVAGGVAKVTPKQAPILEDSASAERRMPPARASALANAVQSAIAQTERPVTLTGRVVSAKTGEPIASAQVALSNPRVVAATDTGGTYALAVPPSEAAGQQAALQVRRVGYEVKTDSITVARDAAPHDFQLAPATLALSQVVVTGTGVQSNCYAISTRGLPARIQLADSVHIVSPDSVAFPNASWSWIGRDSIRIVLNDTTGAEHQIVAHVGPMGLRGQVTDSAGGSGSSVRPFVAKRCP